MIVHLVDGNERRILDIRALVLLWLGGMTNMLVLGRC